MSERMWYVGGCICDVTMWRGENGWCGGVGLSQWGTESDINN